MSPRSHRVLENPAYQAIAGANLSPWTKRMLAHVIGRQHGLLPLIAPQTLCVATSRIDLINRYEPIRPAPSMA